MRQRIAKLLREALLYNGPMSEALYEYELAEHIDYWYAGLLRDNEAFVFVVTENSGHTAMVLITSSKQIYINETAREHLHELWGRAYRPNLRQLIPVMARDLADGNLSVNGVKYALYE